MNLGRWIDSLPVEALRNLAGVPPDLWVSGAFFWGDRRRCAIGHAVGPGDPKKLNMGTWLWMNAQADAGVGKRFDRLCERFGPRRIGRLVSERALSRLSRRGEVACAGWGRIEWGEGDDRRSIIVARDDTAAADALVADSAR